MSELDVDRLRRALEADWFRDYDDSAIHPDFRAQAERIATEYERAHQHVWKREYAPNYRQASEANDWREECACGAMRTGSDRFGEVFGFEPRW